MTRKQKDAKISALQRELEKLIATPVEEPRIFAPEPGTTISILNRRDAYHNNQVFGIRSDLSAIIRSNLDLKKNEPVLDESFLEIRRFGEFNNNGLIVSSSVVRLNDTRIKWRLVDDGSFVVLTPQLPLF